MHLRPLTLADREPITEHLRRFPPEVSELTFTNLYAWHHSRPIQIALHADTFLFFTEKAEGLVLLGPPVGTLGLPELFTIMGGTLIGVERFPATALDTASLPSGWEATDDRDNADYIYRREDLASLAGRNFSKKRNLIKQCLAANACSYEPITLETVPDCLAMQDRWCANRNCHTEPGLCGENLAIRETLDHFGQWGLIGGAIRIEGQIEAFTLAEALSPDTAVCHFEKATPDFRGLGQLINQWFAQYGLDAFTFINREQDLGIPGLRQAKESYRPDHLVEKVCIVRQGRGMGGQIASEWKKNECSGVH